jgi:preprotein translocase subunit SecA
LEGQKTREMSLAGGIKRITQPFSDSLGLGSRGRTLKHYHDKVAAVNAFEPDLRRASEEQLREGASFLKRRARAYVAPEATIVELFALVRYLDLLVQ